MGAALTDAAAVVGPVAARGEDHHRRILELPELVGDCEAVDPRKLNVEQNEVGLELPGGSTAVSPFSASPTTSNPSASSSVRALARKLGWSSTIRTVTPTVSSGGEAIPNTVTHTLFYGWTPTFGGCFSGTGPPPDLDWKIDPARRWAHPDPAVHAPDELAGDVEA